MDKQTHGFASKLKVLIEGYAKELENGWMASSTTTLIESNGKKIIVDPGCNRPKLLQVLAENNFTTSDIDFVFLTHTHTDHALLAGVFENARVLASGEICRDDEQAEWEEIIPDTDVQIIETPGHTSESYSLLVNTEDGAYIVAGDVFWWIDDEEQKVDVNKEDDAHPQETDMLTLRESREKILQVADFIIPGHGELFKTR